MPHIIIEYSANLRDALDPASLVEATHRAAAQTGAFQPDAIRTRAVQRDVYRVADGKPNRAFVHVVLRMRPGREPEMKQAIGQAVFEALCTELAPAFDAYRLGLTFELQEIDTRFRFMKDTPTARQIGAVSAGKQEGKEGKS